MRFDIITLFPEFFRSPLSVGLMHKAIQNGIAEIHCTNPRDFTLDKHHKVDDEPYGGGVGMVMKPDPIFAAIESLPCLPQREIVYLSPQGEPLTQSLLQQFSQNHDQLVLLCGHYEGVDERVVDHLVTREISVGDYVLTCGEIPALTLINGIVRLLPGTVGKPESLHQDSFQDGLLDYPHYTRPPDFRGWSVPPVLRSGNHGAIAQWRRKQQMIRTQSRRPDLYASWLAQQEQTDATAEQARESTSENEGYVLDSETDG